jgi:hypothetical protein
MSNTDYTVRDVLCDFGCESAVVFDNPDYDAAIVGFTTDGRAVYDYDLMQRVLEIRDEMSAEEALDWLDYNTIRAIPYAGEFAPVVMTHIENPDADALFGEEKPDARF